MSGGTPSFDNGSVKRNEVIESIRDGKLVIVTGTGVSMQTVGYPATPNTEVAGWLGLLKNGLPYCKRHNLQESDDTDVVELQLSKNTTENLIAAAQQIHTWIDRKNGNPRYFWLKESIGQLKVQNPSLINALDALAKLGGILTTLNYDDLLEKTTSRLPLHWKQQLEIDQHLFGNSKSHVLHIHGYWEEPLSIVLDRTSYEEISTDIIMQQLMQRFARWERFLFVGCRGTFLDPNFQTLLKWSNVALKTARHRHFVLCREEDEATLLSELRPFGTLLEPLVFGKSFSELSQYLESLATDSIAKNLPLTPLTQTAVPNFQKPADIWRMQWKR
jgi:hypothetical protein